MPRFFFDVLDGRCAADEIGVDLQNEIDARQEALRRATVLLRVTKSKVNSGPGQRWKIKVTDETGYVVFQIDARPGMIGIE